MRRSLSALALFLAPVLLAAPPASAQYRGREATATSAWIQAADGHTAWGGALGAGMNFAEGRLGLCADLVGFGVVDLDGRTYGSLTPIQTTLVAGVLSLGRFVGMPLEIAALPALANARLDWRLSPRWKLVLDNRTDLLFMNEDLDRGVSWRPGAGVDARVGVFRLSVSVHRHVHWNWDGADLPARWGVGVVFSGGKGR